ncbi:hypothetical protein M0802_007462 [Mischocyttarus mexicanus]|nr:hypothetical protein M0802_007462 [Mischocyttarus mexicanus]
MSDNGLLGEFCGKLLDGLLEEQLNMQNDDLVFDQDGKQSSLEIPLIEKHEEQSNFHNIKKFVSSVFGSFLPASSTAPPSPVSVSKDNASTSSTTTLSSIGDIQENNEKNTGVRSVNNITNTDISNSKKSNSNRNFDRPIRDSQVEYVDNKQENEIGDTAEGRRVPENYVNSDDEDLVGSGEIEGSATDSYFSPPVTESPRTDGKARFYRITMTVGEPFRREYMDRNSKEYKELSGNLTQALEELYARHIPNYDHIANVIKISPTSDAFTSTVVLDIGSTFTDELEVRDILVKQLQYHSLGGIQIFLLVTLLRFNDYGGAEKERVLPECDQSSELQCRNGQCVPLDSRCDGVNQCEDGSDENGCTLNVSTLRPTTTDIVDVSKDYGWSSATEVTSAFEERTSTEKKNDDDDDNNVEDSTSRRVSNKCRADDVVRCEDGSRVICSVQRCDGVPDCENGADEIGCPHPGCKFGEFACDVRRCILESQRCNFVEDCQDGSDEHNCNYPTCTSSQFKCKNEECIDGSKHCDGVPDCRDRSDEYDCLTTCSSDQFRCTDGTCLSIDKRCNGMEDCRNGEDENQCGE